MTVEKRWLLIYLIAKPGISLSVKAQMYRAGAVTENHLFYMIPSHTQEGNLSTMRDPHYLT